MTPMTPPIRNTHGYHSAQTHGTHEHKSTGSGSGAGAHTQRTQPNYTFGGRLYETPCLFADGAYTRAIGLEQKETSSLAAKLIRWYLWQEKPEDKSIAVYEYLRSGNWHRVLLDAIDYVDKLKYTGPDDFDFVMLRSAVDGFAKKLTSPSGTLSAQSLKDAATRRASLRAQIIANRSVYADANQPTPSLTQVKAEPADTDVVMQPVSDTHSHSVRAHEMEMRPVDAHAHSHARPRNFAPKKRAQSSKTKTKSKTQISTKTQAQPNAPTQTNAQAQSTNAHSQNALPTQAQTQPNAQKSQPQTHQIQTQTQTQTQTHTPAKIQTQAAKAQTKQNKQAKQKQIAHTLTPPSIDEANLLSEFGQTNAKPNDKHNTQNNDQMDYVFTDTDAHHDTFMQEEMAEGVAHDSGFRSGSGDVACNTPPPSSASGSGSGSKTISNSTDKQTSTSTTASSPFLSLSALSSAAQKAKTEEQKDKSTKATTATNAQKRKRGRPRKREENGSAKKSSRKERKSKSKTVKVKLTRAQREEQKQARKEQAEKDKDGDTHLDGKSKKAKVKREKKVKTIRKSAGFVACALCRRDARYNFDGMTDANFMQFWDNTGELTSPPSENAVCLFVYLSCVFMFGV